MSHDNPVDSQTITLDPGETQTVTLEWTTTEKGYWVATVNAGADSDSGTVEVYENDVTVVTPAATASATAPTGSVTSIKNPTVVAPGISATATAPTPTLTTHVNRTITPGVATASVSAPIPEQGIAMTMTTPTAQGASTAPTPSLLGFANPTIGPSPATATSSAPVPVWRQEQTIQPEAAGSSDIARPVGLVGERVPATVTAPLITASTTTPVPTFAERAPVLVQPPGAETTASGVVPSRVEAVSPLDTIEAIIETKVPRAPTNAEFAPDLSDVLTDADEPDLNLDIPDNHRLRDIRTTDRGEFTSPSPPRRVETEDTTAYTPVRQVYLNDQRVKADRNITISTSEYGFATATIELYNIDHNLWTSVSKEDTVKVDLGWVESGTETVFEGEIVIKRDRPRAFDDGRVIRARDRAAGYITRPLPRTFNDMSPHRIVEQIASDIDGIGQGYIGTGSDRISGSYTLSGGKELADWFDKLAQKATQQTGERWVWYLENGDLYFHRKTDQVTDHVGFSLDKSIQKADPAGLVGQTNAQQQYEVLLRCEPVIHRGLTTTIEGAPEAINPENTFRVASYVHESSTVKGSHHTTATFDPLFKDLEELNFANR